MTEETKEEEKKEKKAGEVFYLCNGEDENCKKNNCYKKGGMCKHTTDIRFAKNFYKPYKPARYREKDEAVPETQP